MGSRPGIRRLDAFDGGAHPVLSTYLNLQPERQVHRTYRVVFSDLLKQLEPRLDEPAREALGREAENVRQYLDEEPPRGKGLATFSCTPRRFWQAYHLPVVVADSVTFDRRPYVRPLLDMLDEYERYAVAPLHGVPGRGRDARAAHRLRAR